MVDSQSPSFRLSIMMFLQYAVWGLWLPIIGNYLQSDVSKGGLGFTAQQLGWIVGLAASVGALTAPFIAGQLADRFFRTERFLGVLLVLGGTVQYLLSTQTSFPMWLGLSVAYSILFMPTLSLTNSLAMSHMENSENQFPRVRLWGTIGWIAAGWLFGMFWMQQDLKLHWYPPFFIGADQADATARIADAFKVSGLVSVAYGIYCFLFLPATYPKPNARDPLAFRKAFKLLKIPSIFILIVAALIISLIHQVYFLQAGTFLVSKGLAQGMVGAAMTIGQVAEIVVMAGLGFLLARLGFKWVLVLGALAFVMRYAVFAIPDVPLPAVIAAIAFHGVCYACFFATSFLYIDRVAAKDVRHSAQAVFGIVILGLGPVLSTLFANVVTQFTSDANGILFPQYWAVMAGMGLLATLLLAVFFKAETGQVQAEG